MTKDNFTTHCRVLFNILWRTLETHEGVIVDNLLLRFVASDLRMIAAEMDDLCNVYEMENQVK